MVKNRDKEARRTYHVDVVGRDGESANVQVREHAFAVNVKKGDGAAGPNAAETLLAALGICLLTNVNDLAAKMHLQIDAARVEIDGIRRDEPPGMVQIRYRLILESPAPVDKLDKLRRKAFEWGTVSNTLLRGVPVNGELVAEKAAG